MNARPAGDSSVSTLVVDTDAQAAAQLAAQLTRAGVSSKVAVTCRDAADAVKAQYFRSIIVVAALGDAECLACLRSLSQLAPRSWLIVISSNDDESVLNLVHRCGGDALVTTPFSVGDLVSRLEALSRRQRPL